MPQPTSATACRVSRAPRGQSVKGSKTLRKQGVREQLWQSASKGASPWEDKAHGQAAGLTLCWSQCHAALQACPQRPSCQAVRIGELYFPSWHGGTLCLPPRPGLRR